MPQGAGYGGKDTGSSDPRGGQGGDGHYGGGVGPHGGRSQGGVGSATPGGWGFGGNGIMGGGYFGGPRRQQGTIASRPPTLGNLGTAFGSLLPGGSIINGLRGLINGNMDPYSGPVGQAHFSGADTPGSLLGGGGAQGQGLLTPTPATAATPAGPTHPQWLMNLLQGGQVPQTMPGGYRPIGGPSPYGVNLPGFRY